MKIEITVSEDRKRYAISIDGSRPVPMDDFMLLTREGEKTRNLVFGPIEDIGRLLYGFYVNCWRYEETGMRDILELVAEDIQDGKETRAQASQETLRRLM
jgi:hypothetical protein